MSRLEFAPKREEIAITDIKSGQAEFAPKPEKAVSFAALKTALKRAGYTLASAEIEVAGKLVNDHGWRLVVEASGQRFALAGDEPPAAESAVEVIGDWKTEGEGADARELIRPRETKRAMRTPRRTGEALVSLDADAIVEPSLAPVRTTSPGLTVFQGGALSPRYSFTRQSYKGAGIDRHALRLGLSYTPHPRIQLEAETAYNHTSFTGGGRSGGGAGWSNLSLAAKYRFFRRVEAWGDRQASVRFGVELPTGAKDAPPINAPDFVRQQLSPISNGFAEHVDASYSQARGRFIFGGNVELTARGERDGFRMGHELRANTDLEYVIFPLKYRRPVGELFAILETSFTRRGLGRLRGAAAPESDSTEYFIAPALQYVATERLVLEASYQIPVAREIGAQALRTDRNLLVGIRFLY